MQLGGMYDIYSSTARGGSGQAVAARHSDEWRGRESGWPTSRRFLGLAGWVLLAVLASAGGGEIPHALPLPPYCLMIDRAHFRNRPIAQIGKLTERQFHRPPLIGIRSAQAMCCYDINLRASADVMNPARFFLMWPFFSHP